MKIKIGFFTVFLALTLLLDHTLFSFAAFLSALIHETGHIVAARFCHIRLQECKLGIYGAGLMPESGLFSYKKEMLLCLFGPLFNLLSVAVCLLLRRTTSQFSQYFIVSSLSMGLLNLLPICDFDGGRILHSLLCFKLTPDLVTRIIRILSFFCVFILWCFSVYLLLRASSSLSLFIFSLSLFFKIFLSEDSTVSA